MLGRGRLQRRRVVVAFENGFEVRAQCLFLIPVKEQRPRAAIRVLQRRADRVQTIEVHPGRGLGALVARLERGLERSLGRGLGGCGILPAGSLVFHSPMTGAHWTQVQVSELKGRFCRDRWHALFYIDGVPLWRDGRAAKCVGL